MPWVLELLGEERRTGSPGLLEGCDFVIEGLGKKNESTWVVLVCRICGQTLKRS